MADAIDYRFAVPAGASHVADGAAVHYGALLYRDLHGVPVHAPCSGRVMLTFRSDDMQMSIRADSVERTPVMRALPAAAAAADIRGRCLEAGLVGLGGGGYPTHRKFQDAAAKHVHTLVANGVACEPGMSADRHLLRTQIDGIVRGALLAARATGARRIVLAHSAEHPVPDVNDASVDVRAVPIDPYPSGEERRLLTALFGVHIPGHSYPTDAGYVVSNVSTLFALHEAADLGLPLTHRWLDVNGTVVCAAIGTPTQVLDDAAEVRIGGLLSGQRCRNDGAVVKTTLGVHTAAPQSADACIRCGRCALACPEALLPDALWDASRLPTHRVGARVQTLDIDRCIECGVCNAVCPSRLELVTAFRDAKQLLAEERRRESAQHHASVRVAARTARAETTDALRHERRQARLRRGTREWDAP